MMDLSDSIHVDLVNFMICEECQRLIKSKDSMPNKHSELVIAVVEGFRMGCMCVLSLGDLTIKSMLMDSSSSKWSVWEV